MNLCLVKLDTWTFCYLQKYPVINKSQKTKKKFSLKVLVFALLFTVLFSSAFAQTLSVPSYSVNRIKSGYVYTFFIKTNQIVRYRVFDSFTGKISVGSAMNGESLVISYNDTVVAWTETAAGTKSREIMLGKNAVQNAISRKFEIISPVEGTWANRQPLVLDCAPETEVYYSFSGYDPLEFGFAYDGPVLIDLNGNITLNLVAVHGDGSITRKTVSYIVNEPVAVKPPLYLSALNPLVICGVEKPVPISQNLTYGIGSHLDASLRGRTLYQTLPSCVNVLLPLEITSGSSVYRYIITTDDAPKTTMIQDKTFSSPIQIIDWNFVLFKADQKLQYSVDGGDWQVYLEPFYLDRTKSHTIRWHTGSKIESLVLPEKPTIIGIPDRNLTNKSVELQFSNPLYTFRIEDIHGVSKPLTSFYADTLAGDERLFDLQLAVYYGNIRQGEISVSFTIDKLPPPAPVLILEDESEYEKCSAVISIYSKEDVFTAIDTNVTSLDFGETSLLYAQNAEPDESAMFMPFAGSRLILGNGDTNEIYTVYAYAQDLAGNKSDTVAVRTQSVFNNVYVDSSSIFAFEADGSPTKPFSSINDAIDVINSRKKTILHLKGSFNIPQNITISSDCSFMGHENVCLSFKNNASLIIRNANVSFENCMFEKNTEQDIRFLLSAGAPLIDARDSKLFLENCKLVSNSSMPQGLIHAVKCYLETDSNNIAVQSLSQAVGVQCFQSNVRSKNDRFSLSGEYAVAFILSDSAFELDSPRFILAAKQAGCVELFACVYSFEENVLKNEIHTSKDFIPFKIDSSSQKGIAPLF